MTHDDERIGYLAGEGSESLSAADRAELDELRSLLATPAMWAEPDPGLESRVVESIIDEAARVAPPRRARRSLRLPRLSRGWSGYAFAGALAAVVAVVVAVSVGGAPAPEQFAMVVYGTALAPSAHGSATLTKTASGWRVDLSATGLPHLANGRYYQAWLRNAAGVLVPIGTFNDARHVTLWSGVPATLFRTLTVTRQVAGGNPASSGLRVLTGKI